VDDYLDSFLTLVSDTSYMDPWTLVVKFCWGLKLNVQSQIATMPFGQHIDTNPEAWYAAVQRIDQVWLANEAFQSTLCSTTLTPTCSALLQLTPLPILYPPPVAPPLVLPRSLLPTLLGGIPMDIDTIQKIRSLPLQGCYQCEEANHLMKDCLYRLDVQRLTT